MERFEVRAPMPGAAAVMVLAGLSLAGCATPRVQSAEAAHTAGAARPAEAAHTADAARALHGRCAGHMYAERALRGGRGPLNRHEYDRCMARGASR